MVEVAAKIDRPPAICSSSVEGMILTGIAELYHENRLLSSRNLSKVAKLRPREAPQVSAQHIAVLKQGNCVVE